MYKLGAMVHRRLVYIYLLNVPSFSSRYFNKVKRMSRLGRLPALSLEILISMESDSRVNLNEQSIIPMGEADVYVKTHVRLLKLNIIDGIFIRFFFCFCFFVFF